MHPFHRREDVGGPPVHLVPGQASTCSTGRGKGRTRTAVHLTERDQERFICRQEGSRNGLADPHAARRTQQQPLYAKSSAVCPRFPGPPPPARGTTAILRRRRGPGWGRRGGWRLLLGRGPRTCALCSGARLPWWGDHQRPSRAMSGWAAAPGTRADTTWPRLTGQKVAASGTTEVVAAAALVAFGAVTVAMQTAAAHTAAPPKLGLMEALS
jgi:hypothetical protein